MDYKKIKKYWQQYRLFVGLFFLLLLIIFLALIFYSRPHFRVQANECIFLVDKASSPRQQYRGLSGKKELAINQGMLFLFEGAADRSFVMRKMNFPLDIIFIKDHRVINLYHNLSPEGDTPRQSYDSGNPADAVLEINAGRARACRLGVGSKISW
jgi:uncharacterized membrane protein (UPF0127 family)